MPLLPETKSIHMALVASVSIRSVGDPTARSRRLNLHVTHSNPFIVCQLLHSSALGQAKQILTDRSLLSREEILMLPSNQNVHYGESHVFTFSDDQYVFRGYE